MWCRFLLIKELETYKYNEVERETKFSVEKHIIFSRLRGKGEVKVWFSLCSIFKKSYKLKNMRVFLLIVEIEERVKISLWKK